MITSELVIEWRHLATDKGTCERCSDTGTAIKSLVETLRKENIKVELNEIKLDASRLNESNAVFINGRSVEEWLKAKRGSSNCPSCSDLVGQASCCRTVVTPDGEEHEALSEAVLLKAARAALESQKMAASSQKSCCSSESCCPGAKGTAATSHNQKLKNYLVIGAVLLMVWIGLYSQLVPLSQWLTYSVFGITSGTHLGQSVEFFLLDTPKVLMLLILVVFGVGIIRSFFTPERTRKILAGKRETVGNVLAALLGVVTPFCSCSAVPLFIGFVTTGVPLGVTFSFLISAPMVNEIALVLLYGLFGWKVAALYMGTGLLIAIVSGWIIGKLHLENHIEDWVKRAKPPVTAQASTGAQWLERIEFGGKAVKDIVGKVWPYVIAGIAVGAGIHGYVPQDYMASIMGKGAWWSVPLAVLIGIPLYSNAAGIIPVVQALLAKGAALGTVLAFMMAVIGLSLPEMVILRKVLKPKLIAAFIGIVGTGILMVGYLFNLLF
jgi:uncharacterized membrane protein YraQ (UPF0718 family)